MWPLIIAGVAALGSAIAGGISAQSQTDAMNRQTDVTRYNQEKMLDFLRSNQRWAEYYNSNARAEVRNQQYYWEPILNRDLEKGYASKKAALTSWLTGQEGLAKRSVEDTLLAGRRQQSASGLYGGLQETTAVTPGVERALSDFLVQGMGLNYQLESEKAANKYNLDSAMMQFVAGNTINSYNRTADMYANMAGQGVQQWGAASQQYASAVGQSAPNPWVTGISSGIQGFASTYGAIQNWQQQQQQMQMNQYLMNQMQKNNYGTR